MAACYEQVSPYINNHVIVGLQLVRSGALLTCTSLFVRRWNVVVWRRSPDEATKVKGQKYIWPSLLRTIDDRSYAVFITSGRLSPAGGYIGSDRENVLVTSRSFWCSDMKIFNTSLLVVLLLVLTTIKNTFTY
jgi:hypothetical protein